MRDYTVYKVPRQVVAVPELPRGPTGKVDIPRMRALLEQPAAPHDLATGVRVPTMGQITIRRTSADLPVFDEDVDPGLEPPRDAGTQPLPGDVRHRVLDLAVFRAGPGAGVE